MKERVKRSVRFSSLFVLTRQDKTKDKARQDTTRQHTTTQSSKVENHNTTQETQLLTHTKLSLNLPFSGKFNVAKLDKEFKNYQVRYITSFDEKVLMKK
jgi:hypothetical protein